MQTSAHASQNCSVSNEDRIVLVEGGSTIRICFMEYDMMTNYRAAVFVQRVDSCACRNREAPSVQWPRIVTK